MPELFAFAFSEEALDYLSTIPSKLRAQVIRKAKALQLDPHPKTARQLKGRCTKAGEPIYRERSGDYRILYLVRDNPGEVVILDVGHRKDVYR